MLRVIIGEDEVFNEETNTFHKTGGMIIDLEHSLLSLSKWESKYQKPFLGREEKTTEEVFEYVKAMILTPDVPADLFKRLTSENLKTITDYIESKESATTFGEMPKRNGPGETITSELIYYWLVAYQIPFSPTETWHLNRLFSLVRISNMKNQPAKKMSRQELALRNRDLNEARKAKYNTSG